VRIIVAGLTAAGKSTHSRLLGAHYGLPYVSMREVMADVLREFGMPGSAGDRWTPAVDESRARNEEIDREADRRMLERIERGPGVFDSWAMPWIYRNPAAVRVWISADLPSRVQKCCISAIARGLPPPPDPAALLEAKDEFSRERFRDLYGFELEPSPEIFEVIVENSAVLPDDSLAHFRADAAQFHRRLVAEIESARGGAGAHQ
jgi:cytidylate kinase